MKNKYIGFLILLVYEVSKYFWIVKHNQFLLFHLILDSILIMGLYSTSIYSDIKFKEL